MPAAALALAACVSGAKPERTAAGPELRLEGFFDGATTSTGVLRTLGGGEKRLSVDGLGRTEADGSFSLQQTIRWADGDVDRRTWRMRRLAGGRYEATVEGVRGVARGELEGDTFHLRYVLDSGPGVAMEHWMTLQPGGTRLRNVAVGRVFGLPVARLDETFARAAP